jgi:peptidoglycan/LPS O-acetylase OafA/YrhL
LNFLALLVVILRFGPALKGAIRWRPLELLGAASLPVFCVHLAAVLLALALVGDKNGATSLAAEVALLAATLFIMYATAWILRSPSARDTAGTQENKTVVSARAAR